QGGFSTGKTMTDNCDIVSKVDNPSITGGPGVTILDPQCHREGSWLPQVKMIGSHPLPFGFRISGTYQTMVIDPISNGTSNLGFTANYVATNALIAPTLGRNLSSGTNATVNILGAGEQYD